MSDRWSWKRIVFWIIPSVLIGLAPTLWLMDALPSWAGVSTEPPTGFWAWALTGLLAVYWVVLPLTLIYQEITGKMVSWSEAIRNLFD